MTTWQQDGSGVLPGGDVGGDIQAGDAYSVRLVRGDRPKAIIDVHVYACEDGGPGASGELFVQVQASFCLCTDRSQPWDTEEWSDARYYDFPVPGNALARADREARKIAAEIAAECPPEIAGWDGTEGKLPEASYPYALTLEEAR